MTKINSLPNGLFIVLEGLDGSGKTTIATQLTQRLTNEGHKVLLTREPGGSEAGIAIRTVVNAATSTLTPMAEFLLFAADRAQHVSEVLLPALARNEVIICDRFTDSSLAYQGAGKGVPTDFINQIHRTILGSLKPTITIYLDVPPTLTHERAATRKLELTQFEKEGLPFFTRIRDAFLKLYQGREDVCIIDASQPVETVFEAAYTCIIDQIKKAS